MSAFQQVENAQRRLDEAQTRADTFKPKDISNVAEAARKAASEAQIAVEQVAERSAARMATVAVAAFHEIIEAAKEAVEAYTAFGMHAMAIRDLMGTSGDEAARITTLFGAFGMNHLASIREINRISRDTMTPRGQDALRRIGVDPKGTNNGQDLFFDIADHLQNMPAGVQKSADMQDIFGPRGTNNVIQILRLTKEQRDTMMDLTSVTEGHLEVIQQWQFQSAMLGATWEQKVIFPLVGLLLPALSAVVFAITDMVDAFGKFNEATHGIAGLVVLVGLLVAGLLLAATAFVALNSVLVIHNGLLAIRAALSGPAGWAALAAAGVIGAGILIGGNMEGKKHQDRHADAMIAHTEALHEMTDTWNRLNAGGVPKGLNSFDIQQLARQQALGAIG